MKSSTAGSAEAEWKRQPLKKAKEQREAALRKALADASTLAANWMGSNYTLSKRIAALLPTPKEME